MKRRKILHPYCTTIHLCGEGKDEVFALFSHALHGSLLYTLAAATTGFAEAAAADLLGGDNGAEVPTATSSAATLLLAVRRLAEAVGEGITETISRIAISLCGCLTGSDSVTLLLLLVAALRGVEAESLLPDAAVVAAFFFFESGPSLPAFSTYNKKTN